MSSAWKEYERSRERSNRAGTRFAAAGVAAFAFLAFHHFYGRDRAPPEASVTEFIDTPADVVEQPAPQRDTGESLTVTVAPGQRAYAADGTTYVGIYECTIKGQRVVSDRSCGADATTRVLEIAPATARPPSVPQYRPIPPSYGPSPTLSAARSTTASPGNTSQCAAVDQEIESLNARMRQRYDSAEGERLRARWHWLKQRRYDLRCGR